MVTKNDLLAPFPKGETAVADRVIGTEYEALVQSTETGQTVPYDGHAGIGWLLSDMSERFEWSRVEEAGKLVELRKDGKSITLEPGGQFELSGAPYKSLGETESELLTHVAETEALEAEYPVRFVWRGMNPWQTVDQINWMPKGRYAVMRRYMPTRGDRGVYMMGMTCTVQANLDFTTQADFARKMKLATGLGPLATALFANSPHLGGKPSGFQSYRAHIWSRTDPDRSGIPRFVFDTDCGYQDYVEYALDVPMYFVKRDGKYVDMTHKGTFRDLVRGRIDGVTISPEDWELHLSTLFPDTRARPHLEVRTCDCVPPEVIMACPALWKGVLYDEGATDAAWDLVKNFTYDERRELSHQAAKHSIRADLPRGRGTLGDLCRELLAIARGGLMAEAEAGRGDREDVRFLMPLEEIVASGITLADRALAG